MTSSHFSRILQLAPHHCKEMIYETHNKSSNYLGIVKGEVLKQAGYLTEYFQLYSRIRKSNF